MTSIGVVLDACILYPGVLRDTLLRAAEADLFRLCLTKDILEEVRRNLIKNSSLSHEQAQRIVNVINIYFEDAFVTRHSSLIPSMPINEKDRHVLAAAIAGGAQIIVTQNLKDFPSQLLNPFDIEALSADTFLIHQLTQNKEEIIKILYSQAESLKNPPQNIDYVLNHLRNFAPNFVKIVSKEIEGYYYT